jgi:nitric oxide reductase NorE protein
MHGQATVGDKPGHGVALPGDQGVFFFITADMAMFAVFFLLFMVGQAQDPEGYRASRAALDPVLGLANTLILVFSGWWMVRAVEAGRAGNWLLARSRVLAAMLFGSAFAITKAYEYYAKISKGITLTSSEFFGYYFAFTGIHFLHFALGIGVMAVTAGKLARPEGAKTLLWLESAAAYWHMVDLLWMVLFPMFYLAGGTA